MVEPDDRQHTSGLKEYEQILDDHECPLAILMQYPPSKGTSVITDYKYFCTKSLPLIIAHMRLNVFCVYFQGR